jgi:hypothetical protein
VALTEAEWIELLRPRKEVAELKVDRAFLKKRLSSSPKKRRLRTGSVRADAGGEEQLHGHPDGPAAGGVEDGKVISRKTVVKGMRQLDLRGICPRRWRPTTVIDGADIYPADAVKRQWNTGTLNQVWAGDITYLRTWAGWLYPTPIAGLKVCGVGRGEFVRPLVWGGLLLRTSAILKRYLPHGSAVFRGRDFSVRTAESKFYCLVFSMLNG